VGLVKGIRRTEARGRIANFAYVEMDTVEEVVRCQKLLRNYSLAGQDLKVTISNETEIFIQEWQALHDRQGLDLAQPASDDSLYTAKIRAAIVEVEAEYFRYREDRAKIEDEQQHPREKEREARKRQIKRDV
jgi:hypothetical protein